MALALHSLPAAGEESVAEIARDMRDHRASLEPRSDSLFARHEKRAFEAQRAADEIEFRRYEVNPQKICEASGSADFEGLKIESGLRSQFCDDLKQSGKPLDAEYPFFIGHDSENVHEALPRFDTKLSLESGRSYGSRSHSPMDARLSEYLAFRIEDSKETSFGRIGKKYDSLSAVMVFLFGAVLMTPEDLGGWPQDRKDRIDKGIGGAWTHNIREGLVMDKDPAMVNYVLHPYSGAAYYMIARTNGLSPIASFGFSFLMSCQWELLETIGEPLSIQDLIATPVIGALLGELFYQVYEAVHAHPEFADSFLGKLTLLAIDPLGSLTNGVDHLAKVVWGPKARGKVEFFVGDSSDFPGDRNTFRNSSSSDQARRWSDLSRIGGRIRFSF